MHNPFGVVNDLKIKIEQLLKPGKDSLDSQSRKMLKLIYNHLNSLEETAKTSFLSDLQKAILSEVSKLRGVVAKISSREFVHMEGLKQRLRSFTLGLEKEKQRCADVLYNTFPEEEEDNDDDNYDAVTSMMIGACDVYEQLKVRVMSEYTTFAVTSLVGMPGIGKTTLAKKVFKDPEIVQRYDYVVWIRVGKKCRVKDIPRRILAEIDPDALPRVDDEEAVHESLKEILKIKSYFIVLDDVWDRYITYLWHPFLRYKMKELDHPFLHPESRSHILLTSRLQQLCNYGANLELMHGVVTMRLLNKRESWDLFCYKVFCKGLSCPPQFEKVGKKISEKCEGLPLTILTVARLLSQEEKSTPEYWNEVAVKKNHRIFLDAYDEISKVLLPSYTYLPPLLKMCFLYIGLFPPKYEVPRTKLVNLWVADRFLELSINIISNFDALTCLKELVSNILVIVYKKSTINALHTVKTCGLHSSLWHLSKQKARETKFALIVSNPDDCLEDDMKGHNRLSIHSNVLLGIKHVHKSLEDNCASDAHSLLCFGPYHQYQVPLCFRLEFLRELDALSIRFYEFPMEVLQLVWLTYLSLTSNGVIPSSICQLQFLEFFIVDRHQSIKSCKETSYLPVEIWRMSALKHLQVMGNDLPDPDGATLGRLSTLSKVSSHSCTEAVLKGVPNLQELYIQIELVHDDDIKPLSWANISHCGSLVSLKCVITNPDGVPPVVPFPSFSLKWLSNLCLSGLSYPWEEMRKIASLPSLLVLKLKKYAFQGPSWEVGEREFNVLTTLVLEDVDMVEWKVGCDAFQGLMSLTIKNCYKLEKVHGKFRKGRLCKIEIVDCNPMCTKEIAKALPEDIILEAFDVHSSWEDDGKHKTSPMTDHIVIKVPRTKLINLWIADRFLELSINIISDIDALTCLKELLSNIVVMIYKKNTTNVLHIVTTCGLHSSLWHLSKQKARETKFALIVSNPDDCLEDMRGHRRLSIHSNVLLGIKLVHKSLEDNCASDAHSLLCFSPYHRYQVPLCFRLELLRELDALSISFYEFPTEVLQLVRLTYLSLTTNGIIPSSICQLQFLEFFIVDRHQSIKSCKDASYLPTEIWRLSALKHLQVMGSDLPDPDGASLDSLLTLSKVSARSCIEAVLKGVPNLRELYIQIELVPDDDIKPVNWAHISHCISLFSLKCVITNPNVVPPVVPFLSFTLNELRNLCLSGLSYPWKELRKIASLPSLLVLKLKKYAFQGPSWEVGEREFNVLISLVLEDVDLVEWKVECGAFQGLLSLTIKNCYKLKKVHGKFSKGLRKIDIVDCNPMCTKEIVKALPEDIILQAFDVHSSWYDGELKTSNIIKDGDHNLKYVVMS